MTTTVATPSPTPKSWDLSRPRLVGRRVVAAGIDLLLLPSMLARLGDIVVGTAGEWVGRVLGIAGTVALQGFVGVSLGMAVVGLVVTRADGSHSPPGLRRSALRHAWLLALLLPALPSLAYSTRLDSSLLMALSMVGSLLGLLGIALPPLLLGTVIADAAGRGLHDRWSGSTVVPTRATDHPAATVGILLLVWAVLTGAAWWLGEPNRLDSDRLGGPDLQHATCEVRYEPPVGEPQRHTVELSRGMDRVRLRLGPHVVRFDDEPFPSMRMPSYSDVDDDGTDGLFYEVGAQSYGGMSSSGDGSGDSFQRDIEISGGLTGGLRMTCEGERDGAEAFTPSVTTRPSDQ